MGIQWAPGTEGAGEGGIVYEGGPKIVLQDMGGGGSGGGGKTEVQQGSGAGGAGNRVEQGKVEIAE